MVVSLLLLLIITIMGLATMRSSTMEERMARYSSEQAVAFQAAEATLRDAEIDLTSPTSARAAVIQGLTGFAADCNVGSAAAAMIKGLCLPTPSGPGAVPVWQTQLADPAVANATVTYGTYGLNPALPADGRISSVAQQPRYIVEGFNAPIPGNSLKVGKTKTRYRVTAQGFGPRVDVQALVQTTVQP